MVCRDRLCGSDVGKKVLVSPCQLIYAFSSQTSFPFFLFLSKGVDASMIAVKGSSYECIAITVLFVIVVRRPQVPLANPRACLSLPNGPPLSHTGE